MGNILNFKRDADAASAGRWFRYREDIELRIAAASQAEWRADVRAAIKAERKPGDGDPVLDDEFMIRHARAIQRHLLRDWRNITDDADQPIPYSEAKALEYLTDPGMADLRTFILAKAGEAEAYHAAQIKAAAGN